MWCKFGGLCASVPSWLFSWWPCRGKAHLKSECGLSRWVDKSPLGRRRSSYRKPESGDAELHLLSGLPFCESKSLRECQELFASTPLSWFSYSTETLQWGPFRISFVFSEELSPLVLGMFNQKLQPSLGKEASTAGVGQPSKGVESREASQSIFKVRHRHYWRGMSFHRMVAYCI